MIVQNGECLACSLIVAKKKFTFMVVLRYTPDCEEDNYGLSLNSDPMSDNVRIVSSCLNFAMFI